MRRATAASAPALNARMKNAKNLFNESAKRGVAALLECGEIPENTADAIATYLLETKGLSKTQIGEYLGEHAELNVQVLAAFAHKHAFENKSFVDALRSVGAVCRTMRAARS